MENNSSLKEVLTSVIVDSTSHGIPRLFKSRTILMKLIWFICTFCSIVYCVYATFSVIVNYLNFDTITIIDTIVEMPSMFPAITICNLNPFQTDKGIDYFYKLYNQFTYLNNITDDSQFDDIDKRTIVLNKLSANNVSFIQEIAFEFNQTFIQCMFNTKKCNIDDFEWYFDPFYGNCFRFNTGKNYYGQNREIKKLSQTGDVFGLRLELFIGYINKTIGMFKRNGIQVMVNNQSNYPNFNEGITVAAGAETNVKIQRIFSYKLGQPYNECIEPLNLDAFDSDFYKYIISSNRTYRQKHCFLLCAQNEIIKKCGCYLNIYDKLNGEVMCLELSKMNCALNISREFFLNKITETCGRYCPVECNSNIYSLSSTTSQYPSPQYLSKIVKLPTIEPLLSDISLENNNNLKYSFLALNIFYDDLGYICISEEAKLQPFDLISNIGGLFGLFIGVSFLSFVEITELLIETICWFLRKNNFFNNNNKKKIFQM